MQPFAPPSDSGNLDNSMLIALVVWMVAGAALGLAVGFVLDLAGVPMALFPAVFGGALTCSVGGFLAYRIDRRQAERRTAVVDGQGQMTTPPRAWVLGAPLGLILVGLLLLAVVGSVRAASILPAIAFTALAVAVAFLYVPLMSREAVALAVEAAEQGRRDEARSRFLMIESRAWHGRSKRSLSRLNLGLMALLDGDLDASAGWYDKATHPRVRPFACTGRALAAVLASDWEQAEAALREATTTSRSRAVQGEIDGVRSLLILRRDGPAEAADLCRRIYGHRAGALFLGVYAAAKWQLGDTEGTAEILDDSLRASLLTSGLGDAVPDLRALLDAA